MLWKELEHALLCICLGILKFICGCDWEERVVFTSSRNVQNKDGDEGKDEVSLGDCQGDDRMMEWGGPCDVQGDKKVNTIQMNSLPFFVVFIKTGTHKI